MRACVLRGMEVGRARMRLGLQREAEQDTRRIQRGAGNASLSLQ